MRILVAVGDRTDTTDHEVYAALPEHGVDVQIVTSEKTPRRQLRELAPEILFVDSGCTSVAAARWVREARKAHVPVAVGAWADGEAEAWPGRVLRRRTRRRTDGAFARTPMAVRQAREGGVRGPVGLVPPAVRARTRPDVPAPDRSFTVGAVGPLSEDDGVGDLLAAVDRLPEGSRLILAGDGPMQAEAGAHKRVDLRTPVPPDERAGLYAEMDVLVAPSRRPLTRRELLSSVLLEALAGGTPVIGAATGDIPWILDEAGGGMTFPPGDVATLADLLMDVRTDPERWRATGLRASSEVQRRFSRCAGAAALRDLAERLLARQ